MNATGAFLADQVAKSSTGGPIILAGYSIGAHAAVATALALKARGVAVNLLCLFDPLPGLLPVPKYSPDAGPRLGKTVFSLSWASSFVVWGLLSFGWVGAARRLALM